MNLHSAKSKRISLSLFYLTGVEKCARACVAFPPSEDGLHCTVWVRVFVTGCVALGREQVLMTRSDTVIQRAWLCILACFLGCLIMSSSLFLCFL